MNKRARQYIGLLSAVIAYYLLHEGTHLLYALSIGAFKQINLMDWECKLIYMLKK